MECIKTNNNNYLCKLYDDIVYISGDLKQVLRTCGESEWEFALTWDREIENIEISTKEKNKLLKQVEKMNEGKEVYWEVWNSQYDCIYGAFFSFTKLQKHLKKEKENYGGDERIIFVHPNLKNSWLEEFETECPHCGEDFCASYTDSCRDVYEGHCHNCNKYICKPAD